jgi:hypothetical protein
MAKKNIGIYSTLQSTANNKVEDLYLIVDQHSIVFNVKNNITNEFVAIEQFENGGDQKGWSGLIAYLQNNSSLIHNIYKNVYFVYNNARVILTKTPTKENSIFYQQELSFIHGNKEDEELYFNAINEQTTIVYSVPDALSALLSRTFPTGKWVHYAAYVAAQKAINEVQVYIFAHHFCLHIIKDGKTQLLSYFPVEGIDQNGYTILQATQNTLQNLAGFTLRIWSNDNNIQSWVNFVTPYFEKTQIEDSPHQQLATYFIF